MILIYFLFIYLIQIFFSINFQWRRFLEKKFFSKGPKGIQARKGNVLSLTTPLKSPPPFINKRFKV